MTAQVDVDGDRVVLQGIECREADVVAFFGDAAPETRVGLAGRAVAIGVYGSRLRRSRQRVPAREQLQAAIEVFDDVGATPWSATARDELAATGVTARQRNGSTRYQMTPQELQAPLLLASQHRINRPRSPVPQPKDGGVPPPERLPEARLQYPRRTCRLGRGGQGAHDGGTSGSGSS
jgi:hypothetical protein